MNRTVAVAVVASLAAGCQILSGHVATTFQGGAATVSLGGPPTTTQRFTLYEGTDLSPGVSDLDGAHLHDRAADGTLLFVQWLGSEATAPTMYLSDADHELYGSWTLGERDADCIGGPPSDDSGAIQVTFECESLVLPVDGGLARGRGTVVLTAVPARGTGGSG